MTDADTTTPLSPDSYGVAATQENVKRVRTSRITGDKISRRNSREWALQMLFQMDLTPPETALNDFFKDFWNFYGDLLSENGTENNKPLEQFKLKSSRYYKKYAEELVKGVWDNRDIIDSKLENHIQNWSLQRIGTVDRNVLRLAFYELFVSKDAPPAVVINEAIDIAKYFSTKDSGKFVNGILDNAVKGIIAE